MSRSSAAFHGVNLMPLLDVLLCTMGLLIVILGVINREARLHPAKRMPGKVASAAQTQELIHAREDLELRVEQATTARDKTLADLKNSRTRLSGLEEHSRQLDDQIRSIQSATEQLQTSGGSNEARDQLRLELARLNNQRTELESNLRRARSEAANRQPAFAVIPFEGLYKTNRRPIYIECRADAIILQPEGIVFTETDFLGPGGPGNPLASALRAAQDYWRSAPRLAPDIPNEPYPLLLVRPDGIIAYYLVRDAMSSWYAEFGYELIGEDWKLDFPTQPDPQLKELENRAVTDARQRMQMLAEMSPELFTRKSTHKVQFRVSPFRGGVVREGGPSLGTDPFANDPLGGFGRTAGGAGSIGGTSNGERLNGLNPGPGNAAFEDSPFARGGLGHGARPNATQGNSGYGNEGFGAAGSGGPESSSVGPRYAGMGSGESHPGSAIRSQSSGASPSSEYGGVAMPGNNSGEVGKFAGASGSVGSTASAGQGAASQGNASASSNPFGQPGSGDANSSSGGTPSLSFDARPQSQQQPQSRASRSLADNRGKNWALPTSNTSSVPIQRPIRVECWNDRLVMLPDTRDQQAQVIPLGERTDEAVEQLVAAVRTYTRSWGMAGRGMYWKPQLVLQVAGNAQARAADLQVLLADSGWDVKRK